MAAGGGPPPVPTAVPPSAFDAASSISSPKAATELDRLLRSMHELAVDLGLEPVSATLHPPYDRRSSAQSSSLSSASPRSSHILQPVSAYFPSQWVRRLSWFASTDQAATGSPSAVPDDPYSRAGSAGKFPALRAAASLTPTALAMHHPGPSYGGGGGGGGWMPSHATSELDSLPPAKPPPTVPIPPVPPGAMGRLRITPELKTAPTAAKWRSKKNRRSTTELP
ncbi:hypothetical protein HK405_000814 [Cladochytrium tenue]|nr:hypothetical protein HK405_000814 [Cladochytrium tenue]